MYSVSNADKNYAQQQNDKVAYERYQSDLIENHHEMCIKGQVSWNSEVKFNGTGANARFIYKIFGPSENAFI
jgi:hypothetical protein